MRKTELERGIANRLQEKKSIVPRPAPKPASPLRASMGNQDVQRLFDRGVVEQKQTSLRISRPGDAEEVEADRMAEQAILAQPVRGQQLSSAPSASTAQGKPLDPEVQKEMELRFGRDFTGVRIHDGQNAAESADAVNSRAFTVGNHIAFARGEYAPHSLTGKKLLAHELAHTIQQSNAPSPTLHRSPGPNPRQTFDTSGAHAKDIDKFIANSALKKYMGTNWKTLAGNYDYVDPSTFQSDYETYSKKKKLNKEKVDEVPGFVDRDAARQIKLRRPGTSTQGTHSIPITAATIEAAVHETIHTNSQESFQNDFTHATNEGVTEYFAEMAMGTSGTAYRDELELAKGLITALGPTGEQKVAEAFFKGDHRALYQKIVLPALTDHGTYTKWRDACNAEPPDYKTANALLRAALENYRATGNPVRPPVKQPSPSAGSASGSGAGSATPNAKPPAAP